MYVLDPRTGRYLWHCPECGATIRLTSPEAVRLVEQAGRCQGCRASAAFRRDPGLASFYLDFWTRTDTWPQSDSWLEAISGSGVPVVGNAGLADGRLGPARDSGARQPKRTANAA